MASEWRAVGGRAAADSVQATIGKQWAVASGRPAKSEGKQ